MSKVTIIGAGNVGSTTALRIIEANLADVLLIDITKDIPQGKAFDLEDAAWLSRHNHFVYASDTYDQIGDSDIIVITAGLPRKPGMNREDLLQKNGQIIKGICEKIKDIDNEPIIIVVTNPVDIMTNIVRNITGIDPNRILGMGVGLDASRLANLIRQELKCSVSEIEPLVIGAHGKSMIPLPRFTYVKGKSLTELLSEEKVQELVQRTRNRGAEIIAHLKDGSAFFAPSAAIYAIIKTILFDERRTIGASVYLNGQYGLQDVCIGVPVVVGKKGIEKIVELDLDSSELDSLKKSAEELKKCMICV